MRQADHDDGTLEGLSSLSFLEGEPLRGARVRSTALCNWTCLHQLPAECPLLCSGAFEHAHYLPFAKVCYILVSASDIGFMVISFQGTDAVEKYVERFIQFLGDVKTENDKNPYVF